MPKRYPTIEEKRADQWKRICQTRERLGDDVIWNFLPNNMAAGPCDACTEAAKLLYYSDACPLAPLDGCPHPDQCVGYHRVNYDIMPQSRL